jgi:hypothetical protein
VCDRFRFFLISLDRASCIDGLEFIQQQEGIMPSKHSIIDHLAYGAVVLERFGDASVPGSLGPHVAAFRTEYESYSKAAKKAEAACAERDAAVAAVAVADALQDADIDTLADALVGAKLGPRTNPFKAYSSHSPSVLKAMAYANETRAVRDLVANVLKASPPRPVADLLGALLGHAQAVDESLLAITRPQAAYDKALGDRDALLPGLLRALHRLKRYAAAEWSDAPQTHKAMFAGPERVQRPVARRKPR